MKTTTSLSILILTFMTTILFGQDGMDSEVILVRMYELSAGQSSKIIITYGNERAEEVGLKTGTEKNWSTNMNTFHAVLERIIKRGYTLTGSSSGEYISTYIFIRNDLVKCK